jgi:APA family basic amino acid/polyamine antiporter
LKSEFKIGFYTLVGLVIANMIGSGVFTTSGFAMGDLGSPPLIVLAWFIGGCLALTGAMSYGALSQLMPESGGEYLFLSRAIHPMIGFIAGWVSLLAGFTGAIAYAASAFEAYFTPAQMGNSIPENFIATLVILLATLAHGLHLRMGALLQNISVVIKLVFISVFFFYILFSTSISEWQGVQDYLAAEPAEFSIFVFAMTLMWISFSYSGFNAAVYIASEVKEPVKNLPRALFYGTLVTMFIYIVLNTIFVFAPSPDVIANKQDVAAIVAGVLGGSVLESFVRIIISVALFTSVSAMIMLGPRVYAKMADDGLMPAVLKFDGEVPAAAIMMQAGLAIIVVWISTLRELLSYLGFTLGLSTVITVFSLFVYIRRNGRGTMKLSGYPWAPVIFILFTILFAVLAAFRQPWEMVAAIVTILSGVGFYFLFRKIS